MKNEADFKSAFKKSVKAQGGYAISLAAPMLIGTPDLYVIMPGYAPVLLEAKWLGIVGAKFKRKLQFTAMQRHYLEECNKVRTGSALGLIGFKFDKIYHAVLVLPEAEHLNNDFAYLPWTSFESGKCNVLDLFSASNIPKMNGFHDKIEFDTFTPRS
jgi:hypothetical protein